MAFYHVDTPAWSRTRRATRATEYCAQSKNGSEGKRLLYSLFRRAILRKPFSRNREALCRFFASSLNTPSMFPGITAPAFWQTVRIEFQAGRMANGDCIAR